MTAFHICETATKSGIARYAIDFQAHALAPLGFTLISASRVTQAWIKALPPSTVFHIQLGAQQFAERKAMTMLFRAGLQNIDATLHDPPFLTFPYFSFKSSTMMRLSRGFDWYLGSLGIQHRALRRLRTVYVLSERGRRSIETIRPSKIVRIPHIVSRESIWPSASTDAKDILYFGFIGPAKGIEYALQLHERIMQSHPNVMMHVVGDAMGTTGKRFLADIKRRYTRQVIFHGYVGESQLNVLFAKVRHVFLPFEPYRYFNPASGSIINAMKRGRVIWSTPVNSVPELIEHCRTGLLLTKDLDADAKLFDQLHNDCNILDRIGEAALASARAMADFPYHVQLSADR